MNKTNLKSYAPQARKDFIAAVTARANLLGLSDRAGTLEVAPAQTQGDVTVIAGQAWPAKVNGQRDRLIERIRKDGFGQTMEAIAYTWFNRFAALRYMELHDYLGHGHRALSSMSSGLPDILTHATALINELPGLNSAKVTELKLAGNRDGELYRMLLVAQCNALSQAMPFLFERIDDNSELLLPDNLLHSDSVIAKLVAAIPEEDWAEVEIIGWLYQFYISEKKDQVIGKVVKSEDIPAATQLFTPNWIVQYLVQNSVGRLWLMANPKSTLASQWPYYIQPAEQTPEVQAQLDALIQTRMNEDGGSLNPETITVLDPACGSGHILVVAYDVLKAIYLERGYQPRAIPRLILEKNLYGLDLDDRAAQMAGFALLMKARADDRRLFTATDDEGKLQPPKLNVLSLQESKGLSVDELFTHLALFKVPRPTITALVETFRYAKTFGSLIQIPYLLKTQLTGLFNTLLKVCQSGDLYARAATDDLLPLVQQARLLAMQFDSVVANPPYMGNKGMNSSIKEFAQESFPDSKSDLFAMFIERGFGWCKPSGFNSMVTMQSWMFLSSYEIMREKLLNARSIHTMAHFGARAFSEISGDVVQTTGFVLQVQYFSSFRPVFFRLIEGAEEQKKIDLLEGNNRFETIIQDELKEIPGCPIAYWVPLAAKRAFKSGVKLGEIASPRQGLATADNDTFRRYWYEVDFSKIGFGGYSETKKWFPYNSGGGYRKWSGNQEYVVNWENDGNDIKQDKLHKLAIGACLPSNSKPKNTSFYFRESVSWSKIASGNLSLRYFPPGFIFDVAGCSVFHDDRRWLMYVLGLLNSVSTEPLLGAMSATVNYEVGQIKSIPILNLDNESTSFIRTISTVERCVELATTDWNAYERSWSFQSNPLVKRLSESSKSIDVCFKQWIEDNSNCVAQMRALEEENNRLFIATYGLEGDISPHVAIEKITLTVNPSYRYGVNLSESECSTRFTRDSVEEIISYAIGCMMGRYSLDEPGLIYARAGNVGFEPSRYSTFPADADGIIPITGERWFSDDAPSRMREFLKAIWGADTIEENMIWLAESLGTKASETPDETIRRYVSDKFFKDHLQTYKKRPIYWLFSSGKQGAFQALVYLHRYHEGTLARMRAEYVVPLTSKMQARIDMLQKDAQAARSTAARNKLNKEVEKLTKKHAELLAYDEKLRHYADLRITLDLDDGVKVNYGKFGDLLDSVKVVTGGTNDD